MYICLCNGITDSFLRSLYNGESTISTLRANNKSLKICDKCCKCRKDIVEILKYEKERNINVLEDC